jgi:hypothetical protein
VELLEQPAAADAAPEDLAETVVELWSETRDGCSLADADKLRGLLRGQVFRRIVFEDREPDEDHLEERADEVKYHGEVVLGGAHGDAEQGVQVEVEFASHKLG